MKKRGLGTKGLVILLVAATAVFCAAEYFAFLLHKRRDDARGGNGRCL